MCGGSPVEALPYLALILLMAGATYYQQRQMMASRGATPDNPQAQQMQTFMKVMPLILLVFGLGFPAGVVLYWVTTNAWTIVQQRIMLKAAPPVEATAKTTKAAAGKGGTTKSTSAKTDGKGAKKTTAKNSSSKPAAKSPAGKTSSTGSPGSRNSSKKKKRR